MEICLPRLIIAATWLRFIQGAQSRRPWSQYRPRERMDSTFNARIDWL